jgi:hypothetical protein
LKEGFFLRRTYVCKCRCLYRRKEKTKYICKKPIDRGTQRGRKKEKKFVYMSTRICQGGPEGRRKLWVPKSQK